MEVPQGHRMKQFHRNYVRFMVCTRASMRSIYVTLARETTPHEHTARNTGEEKMHFQTLEPTTCTINYQLGMDSSACAPTPAASYGFCHLVYLGVYHGAKKYVHMHTNDK